MTQLPPITSICRHVDLENLRSSQSATLPIQLGCREPVLTFLDGAHASAVPTHFFTKVP